MMVIVYLEIMTQATLTVMGKNMGQMNVLYTQI